MTRSIPALLLLAAVFAMTLGCSSESSSSSKPSSDSKSGGSAGGNKAKGGNAQNSVEIPVDQQQAAGIRVAQVEPRKVPQTLSVPGQIMMNEERTAHIAPYSDGLVVDVLKYAGDQVERGQTLAHLHSHSVHETVGALAQNYANAARAQDGLVYAQQKRDRYTHLYDIQAASLEQKQGSQQELVQAQTDVANTQAAVIMEREHLADLLQIPPGAVSPASLYTYENVPIKAPISGTIITRTITPGMVFEPGNEAFTVSDLSQVWMVAAVSETSLAQLRQGERVSVRSDAWPGQSFPGVITLIGSTLDPTTRTVQVRATLRNPRNQLKPSMFTTATIDEGATREAIFIPEDAMQEVNGVQSAFVTTDGTHFAPRALKTLPAVSGQVEVTDGLRPGEHIVVAGSFLLKSDLLKGTLGEE